MLQTTAAPILKADNEQIFSDVQLLDFIVRGENWALSEIHARYARLVFSIALKILNDQARAEEIVQQVFMKVWRHARLYRLERGKFSAWVGKITRHECIDELRRHHTWLMTEPSDWESLDQLAGSDDPDRDLQVSLEQDYIRAALQQIPVRERIVIELAFWGDMSQNEIALYCDFPLGTVKTRMRLGMKRLKLLLQESA